MSTSRSEVEFGGIQLRRGHVIAQIPDVDAIFHSGEFPTDQAPLHNSEWAGENAPICECDWTAIRYGCSLEIIHAPFGSA